MKVSRKKDQKVTRTKKEIKRFKFQEKKRKKKKRQLEKLMLAIPKGEVKANKESSDDEEEEDKMVLYEENGINIEEGSDEKNDLHIKEGVSLEIENDIDDNLIALDEDSEDIDDKKKVIASIDNDDEGIVKEEEEATSDIEDDIKGQVLFPARGFNHIKIKEVRNRMVAKEKRKKKQLKIALKKLRLKEEKLTGVKQPRKEGHTIETTREKEVTLVNSNDEELLEEEETDSYAAYFSQLYEPTVMITTSFRCGPKTRMLSQELCLIIPLSEYKTRMKVSIESVCEAASQANYTDLIIINDNKNRPNAMTVVHLPSGPTARFEITSYLPSTFLKTNIKGLNRVRPEVLLNNFTSRLGRLVSRMLASLFHFDPEFMGRRAVTFHNQRDFIFFRYHKYQFKSGKKAHLDEIGPRFTLRLEWLQLGAFKGDYEFMKKGREMEFLHRKRFFL